MDLREILPESRFLLQILENLARIWKFQLEFGNLSIGSGFSGFKGGKPKPTCWNLFLVVKTHRRPIGAVGLVGLGSDPVGSLGGSSYWINLDSATLNHTN